jgi:hypothetical protein
MRTKEEKIWIVSTVVIVIGLAVFLSIKSGVFKSEEALLEDDLNNLCELAQRYDGEYKKNPADVAGVVRKHYGEATALVRDPRIKDLFTRFGSGQGSTTNHKDIQKAFAAEHGLDDWDCPVAIF